MRCEGALSREGQVPGDFAAAAKRMPPMVSSVLVDGLDPSTVPLKKLLAELGICHTLSTGHGHRSRYRMCPGGNRSCWM